MDSREWVLILGQWFAVGVFSVAAVHARSKRIRAVAEAGPLVLRVTRPRVRAWLLALFFPAFITIMPSWVITLTDGWPPRELAHVVASTIMPLIVYPMVHAAAYVEARERGIICNQAFWSWGHIQEYEWLDDRPTLRLRRARYDFTDFRIAKSQRDALDHILRQNMRGVGIAEQDSPARHAKSA